MNGFMSRNSRAPTPRRRLTYRISLHALQRFRERVDDEYASRDDDDLINLFDEKLRFAEKKHDVRDPRAPGEVTTLYELSTRKAGTFYAVVRQDTAVTVLDEDMVKSNFAEQFKPILHLPFAGLKDLKLPGAVVDASEATVTIVPQLPVIAAVQVEPDPARQAFIDAWKRRTAAERAFDEAERELDEAEAAFDAAARDIAVSLETKES